MYVTGTKHAKLIKVLFSSHVSFLDYYFFFTFKVKRSDRTKNLDVSKGDEDVSTYCIL